LAARPRAVSASTPRWTISRGFAQLTEDLAFLLTKIRRPIVAWHEPNFGVRFEDYVAAIESAVPPGRMRHIAESSMSLLAEPHLKRLSRNGFQALLPGIESWFSLGNKSKTRHTGMDKVKQVAEHVNLILRYIPYVQTNFVLGLDSDEGPEPFELTKNFIDLAPGAFPAYSLLSAFGRVAPMNLDYQRAGRVLPFPFHFQDNNQAMNVRPLHYSWPQFYDHLVDVTRHSFSWRAIGRRFQATRTAIPKWMNLVRAVSSEGLGRLKYHSRPRHLLDTDISVRRFLEGDTNRLPEFYRQRIQSERGPLFTYLPEGAMMHDPNAYLKTSQVEARPEPIRVGRRSRPAVRPAVERGLPS
jgi:hypothetical protein